MGHKKFIEGIKKVAINKPFYIKKEWRYPMQIVTVYDSDTVSILNIYRHYFFSAL